MIRLKAIIVRPLWRQLVASIFTASLSRLAIWRLGRPLLPIWSKPNMANSQATMGGNVANLGNLEWFGKFGQYDYFRQSSGKLLQIWSNLNRGHFQSGCWLVMISRATDCLLSHLALAPTLLISSCHYIATCNRSDGRKWTQSNIMLLMRSQFDWKFHFCA